ncbi:phage tail tape measure protein [Streptomyces sp. NPDC056738]|uniref:phage tail tape measure protein n=1 Tax=Streptomyces sp. NPDC056738 TaxID=3345933 RepID=UPI0036AD5096
MATRTVTVRLRADISSYTRGMRAAARSTSDLAGKGATVGTAMVTAFAVAAASAAKFDKAMSQVRAATGASSTELNRLRDAALKAGAATNYSASQAAEAEAELARAGISTADIVGGALKGSLDLAAAGQLDLAEAAVLSAQAMNSFNLKGKDMEHIADVIAAGAGKSATNVHDMGMAFRQVSVVASQTGLSLEDTVGTLAEFAQGGLTGSDAGTSFKTMLQRLVPQSQEAADMMKKLGLTVYDSQGNFIGMKAAAGQMRDAFSKLTPEARNSAMATIFGSDAVRAASIIYQNGEGGLRTWIKGVNDTAYASRTAGIQTDNLSGDLERLQGAIEVALIQSGSGANTALRGMTQWITKVVNAYNDLPPELQKTVTGLTGVGGAALLVVSGVLLMLPRIAATRTALVGMGLTAARARAAMSALGTVGAVIAGLAAVTYAAGLLKDKLSDAPVSTSKLSASLLELGTTGKKSGELTKQFGGDLNKLNDAVTQIAHPSTTDKLNHLTESWHQWELASDHSLFDDSQNMKLSDAKNYITAIDEALTSLVQSGATDEANAAFLELAGSLEGTSPEKFKSLLHGYTDALADTDVQGKLTAGSQKDLGKEAKTTAEELKAQKSAAEQLSDALNSLNGKSIGAAEAEIGFRQSLADLNTAVKENGHSLDVTGDKGRKVKGAFLEAAKAAQQHAEAVADQTNNQAAGQKALETDIALLKKDMLARGFSKDAVDKLAAAYLKLPPKVTTTIDAKTQGAINDLSAVQAKVKSTKGRTFTMSALTKEARDQLESLGFKIKNTKGKKVTITVPTGGQKRAVDALAAAIRALHDKSVAVTTTFYTKGSKSTVAPAHRDYGAQANGSILSFYANGGMHENHVAQIAKKGSWRVWAEDEAGDEAYIPLNPSKRPRSRQIAAETVKRLGGAVQWFAGGGIPGFTYTPTGAAVLGGPSDAKQRYDGEIEDLKKAWDELNKALKEQKKAADSLRAAEKNLSKVRHGHHTAAQLRSAEERVDKAKAAKKKTDATVRKDRAAVNAADKELGLKKGAKTPKTFNLKAYETQLDESVAATEKWRKSLAKVGQRGGKELQAMLEGMGEEGYALVNSLAGASDKQFKSITAKLQKTGELAKATLADFTKQLTGSTKESEQFAKDLQTLAASGFGDLAQALAAQGDSSAMELAHQAAGNKTQAATANAAVGKAQNALTGEDLANSLVLLTTLRGGPNRGYADLIAAGLDTATIKALVPKMTAQIGSLPEANKSTFVRQWVQQGGKAMARGGILNRPTMVLGAEAGDVESWIPWNGSQRSRALLAKTAAGMGYQLVPAGRYGSGGPSAAAVAREMTRITNITLNGAKQTSAEQARDIVRHMSFVG